MKGKGERKEKKREWPSARRWLFEARAGVGRFFRRAGLVAAASGRCDRAQQSGTRASDSNAATSSASETPEQDDGPRSVRMSKGGERRRSG